MEFHARRTQWAVGQGFLHSGVLGQPDGRGEYVAWLYDCGTVSSRAALTRELALLRRRHRNDVGMLYISHFHEDHVSGLDELRNAFRVDQVFMPLLEPWERLLAFGSWASDPPSWYTAFIADPAAWMGQWIESVIQVSSGSQAPLPAATVGGDDTLDDGPGELDKPDGGSGGILTASQATVRYGGPGRPVWVWEPYVLKSVDALRDDFRSEFQVAFGSDPLALGGDDLVSLLGKRAVRANLRTVYRKLLKAAGEENDLNLTSMCLYAGTPTTPRGRWRSRWPEAYLDAYTAGIWRDRPEVGAWGQGTGWLLTGDGSLKPDSRTREVRDYYRERYPATGLVGLPHHGSEKNYNPILLQGLESRAHCLVGATTGKYGHPSYSVYMDVQNRGFHLVVVTDEAESRFSDVLTIRA